MHFFRNLGGGGVIHAVLVQIRFFKTNAFDSRVLDKLQGDVNVRRLCTTALAQSQTPPVL